MFYEVKVPEAKPGEKQISALVDAMKQHGGA